MVPLEAGTSTLHVEIRSIAVIGDQRFEGVGTLLFDTAITVTTKDQGFGADVKRWTSSVVDFPLVRWFGSLLVIFGALAAAWRGCQTPVAVEALNTIWSPTFSISRTTVTRSPSRRRVTRLRRDTRTHRVLGWSTMATLDEDMKRVVREQRLGFWATVGEDGSPNLSPKGTADVWTDDHLYFAEICSPQTVENIRRGSIVEVNVVDPFVRKGYRFKGPAVVHGPGTATFAEGVERLRASGSTLMHRVNAIVVIAVEHARAVVSPAYDDGTLTETDVRVIHQARFARLHDQPAPHSG